MSRPQEGPIGAGRKKREEAMYSQAELVLKKKAEIEAKMAKTLNDKHAKVNSIQNRKPITMSIKSRWGLKGKKVLPAGTVPAVTTTSTTENDNSWEKYTTPLQSTLGTPTSSIPEHSGAIYTDVIARQSPPPPQFDPPPQTLPQVLQPQQIQPNYFPATAPEPTMFTPNHPAVVPRMQHPAPAMISQPPPVQINPVPLNPAPGLSFDTTRPPPRYPPPQPQQAVYNHAAPPPPPVISQEASIPMHTIPSQVVSYPHPIPPQASIALQSALPPTPHIQTAPHMMSAPHMTVGLAPNMTNSIAPIATTVSHHQIQMQTTNPMHISHMQSAPAPLLHSLHPASMQNPQPVPNVHTNSPAPNMLANPPVPHIQPNPPAPHMHTNSPQMAPMSHMQAMPQVVPPPHLQSIPQVIPATTHLAPAPHMQHPPQMPPSSHMQTAPQMSMPAMTPQTHLQPIYHVSTGPPNNQPISSSHLSISAGPPPQSVPPMPVGPVQSEIPVHSAPPPPHNTSVPPPHFVPSQMSNQHVHMSMSQAPPPLLVTHNAPPPILTDRPPPFHQPLPPQHQTPTSMPPTLTTVPPPGGGKPGWWSDSNAKEIATTMGRPNSPTQGPPSTTAPGKSLSTQGSQNASGWGEAGGEGRWQENEARTFNNKDNRGRGGDSRRQEEKRRYSDDREDRYSPRGSKDRDNRYRKQAGGDERGFRSKEDGRRFWDTDLRRSRDEDEERFRGSRERRDSRDNLGHKRSEQRRYSEDCSKGNKSKGHEEGARFDAYGGGGSEDKNGAKNNQRQDKDFRDLPDARPGEDARPSSKGSYEGGKCLDIDLRKSSRETEVYSPTRPTYTPTKKAEVSSSGSPLPHVVEELASMVAISGEDLEEIARGRNQTTPELKFLFEKNSSLYARYRERVTELKKTLEETDSRKNKSSASSTSEAPRKRRSRWGDKETSSSGPPPGLANVGQPGVVTPTALGGPGLALPTQLGAPGIALPTQLGAPGLALPTQLGAPGIALPTQLGAPGIAIPTQLGAPVGVIPPTALLPRGIQPNMKLTEIERSNPGLASYAIKVFGTTDLTDSQWKQCEDQLKMSVVYGQMAAKQAAANAASGGKRKYEYDSDEDTTNGTWEHRQRKQEMQKTQTEAEKANSLGEGGAHHIGDYLPPEELTKFMNKYKALRNGDKWDSSDYQENKLQSDNKGFKMLQAMGWSEGAGLGSSGMGITTPIGKSGMAGEKMGLGMEKPDQINANDDEFDSYRKRMMMAYRFRPNPLNNPRRAYY